MKTKQEKPTHCLLCSINVCRQLILVRRVSKKRKLRIQTKQKAVHRENFYVFCEETLVETIKTTLAYNEMCVQTK